MTECLDFVGLPAIDGHTHTLGADGQLTCGCRLHVQALYRLPTNAALVRLRLSSPCTDRVTFHPNCDVGSDIPGGGAA